MISIAEREQQQLSLMISIVCIDLTTMWQCIPQYRYHLFVTSAAAATAAAAAAAVVLTIAAAMTPA
jgi:hypothetical protein